MNFSEIVIGVMRWGSWGANFSAGDCANLISVCLEEGLTTFDHADLYGDYTTESLFGEAFSLMQVPRENIQLISKCGICNPGGSKNFPLKYYDYSKNYILGQVDQSLKNLKTDYLDLLLLHRPSPLMDPEEIAATFGILRNSGKVRDFGVSNFSVNQFDLVLKYFPHLSTNQIEISINKTDSFYDGTLDQMMERKLRPMAWSAMGNYFLEPGTEQNRRIAPVIQQLCRKYNAEENQLLLAFLRRHPAKILPIVGTSKAESVRKFKKSLEIQLEAPDWFAVLEAAQGREMP